MLNVYVSGYINVQLALAPQVAKRLQSTSAIQREARDVKLTTLDPASLTANDYIDLSSESRDTVWFRIRVLESHEQDETFHYPHDFAVHEPHETTAAEADAFTVTIPFPAPAFGAAPESAFGGFLYYNKPPLGAPNTAGSLRFRVTNNCDPSSFGRGHDVAWGSIPWSRPLLYALRSTPSTLQALSTLR